MEAQDDYNPNDFRRPEEQLTSNKCDEPFARHNDSVLCCSIDSESRLAVSGGIDDTAFVWDLNTKHVIFECVGHKESVVAAAFSANSTYVATGDLNGHIQVRNTTTGIKIFDFDIDEINWMQWHNISEYVLLAGTIKGDFWVWNVNDPSAVKTFPSYGCQTTAARLISDGIKLVVSYSDGSIRVFDLKTRQTLLQFTEPSQPEVICLDINPSKALLAVGCIDASVKVMTLGNLKVIGTLMCRSPESRDDSPGSKMAVESSEKPRMDSGDDEAIETEEADADCPPVNPDPVEVVDEFSNDENMDEEDVDDEDIDSDDDMDASLHDRASVESVAFSPCGHFLAAANNQGTIVIWDVSTLAIRAELHTGIGISRGVWSENGYFITGCLDGYVRIYDSNLKNVKEIVLHQDQILDVAIGNRILVTASEDKTCQTLKLLE